MKLYDYQPGNGSRYDIFVVRVDADGMASHLCISPGGFLIGMLNFRNRCYAFQPSSFRPDDYLAVEYVMEHFDFKYIGDAEAMTQFIGYISGRKVLSPWPRCEKCGMPRHPKSMKLCASCVSVKEA